MKFVRASAFTAIFAASPSFAEMTTRAILATEKGNQHA
jgi:hypothetical protein